MIKKTTPLLPSILLTLLFTSLSQSVRHEGDVVDPPQKKYHLVKPNYSDLFDERPGEQRFNKRLSQQKSRRIVRIKDSINIF